MNYIPVPSTPSPWEKYQRLTAAVDRIVGQPQQIG
jgi:hypothetical protein